MTEKILDTLFRYKWLLLLPPLLIPLIVTPLAFILTVSYETRAAIWVERPTYLRTTGDDTGRLTTPAQSQGARLVELLRSRSFLMDIAQQTPLAPLVGTTKGEDKITAAVEKGLTITPNGNNLVVITFE